MNIVFIEKNEEKKLEFSMLDRSRILSRICGSGVGSADPDPDQNLTDPQNL